MECFPQNQIKRESLEKAPQYPKLRSNYSEWKHHLCLSWEVWSNTHEVLPSLLPTFFSALWNMWKISQTKGKAAEKFPKLTAMEKDRNTRSRDVEESTALAFRNQVILRTFDTSTNCSGNSNHKLAIPDNSGCTSLATKNPTSSAPAVRNRVKQQQDMPQTMLQKTIILLQNP